MNATASDHAKSNQLLLAQGQAGILFQEIEKRKLIREGITEKLLNEEIFQLAYELFGIKKYWHKRIVRAGVNTLCPYRENPPDLTIYKNDIVFLDFGPVFEEWEADFGRSFLLGDDPHKLKMIDDLEIVFNESKKYYQQNPQMTGSELYKDIVERSRVCGWQYGGPHAGHLIGKFPHEKIASEHALNYICPDNDMPMNALDDNGESRDWILEVHLVDHKLKCGAFFEDLLTIDNEDCSKI